MQALLAALLVSRGISVLLRLATWGCIAALALLTLLPPEQVEAIRTGINGRLEHLVAYGATMLIAARAYRRRLALARLGLLLVAYAAVLELGQLAVPGRHPSLADLLAGALGVALAGFGLRFAEARLSWPRRAAFARIPG
jgi:hypothetical protein